MEKAVGRATVVIRGLLDFSAASVLRLDAEDLNFVVQQQELTEDLPPVRLDKGKIEQVFVNIFINAIHAVPGGGGLTVRTYATRLTEGGQSVSSRKADHFRVGDTVVVAEVDDTGTAFPGTS